MLRAKTIAPKISHNISISYAARQKLPLSRRCQSTLRPSDKLSTTGGPPGGPPNAQPPKKSSPALALILLTGVALSLPVIFSPDKSVEEHLQDIKRGATRFADRVLGSDTVTPDVAAPTGTGTSTAAAATTTATKSKITFRDQDLDGLDLTSEGQQVTSAAKAPPVEVVTATPEQPPYKAEAIESVSPPEVEPVTAVPAVVASSSSNAVVATTAVSTSIPDALPVAIPTVAVVVPPPSPAASSVPEAVVVAASTKQQLEPILPTVTSEDRARRVQQEASAAVLDELSLQSIALRRELEQTLLKDLQELDEHALRIRVTQLAAEFFERTKWEGIRLHQALKQLESEVSRKYLDLMLQQRSELELEINKVLLTKEQSLVDEKNRFVQESIIKHEQALSGALRDQASQLAEATDKKQAEMLEALQADYDSQTNNFVARLRQKHVHDQLKLQEQLESVRAHLAAFDQTTEDIARSRQAGTADSQFTAAVLALESLCATSAPLRQHVGAVCSAAASSSSSSSSSSQLVHAVVGSLPPAVLNRGALPLSDLKLRFAVVHGEARKLAFVPHQLPPFLGFLVSDALSAVTWAPRGLVKGDGLEESLARVTFFLDQNALALAVKELEEGCERYSPEVAKAVSGWKQLAVQRLVVDQAAKVLRAEAILRHSNHAQQK